MVHLLDEALRQFYAWGIPWGWGIILLTVCVRLLLLPLTYKQVTSMLHMQQYQPQIKALNEKYKDDPQKQQTEMMKLYKEYGVNPLGGCLPIFVQLPIFIGFYSALQVAAELRGQSFLWVQDLSLPDTVAKFAGFAINPLPLIMVKTGPTLLQTAGLPLL